MALSAITTSDNTKTNIDIALGLLVLNDQALYSAFVAWVNAVRPHLEAESVVSPGYQERSAAVKAAFDALKAEVND